VGEELNIYKVGSESTDNGRIAKLAECFSLVTVWCRTRFSMKNQGKFFVHCNISRPRNCVIYHVFHVLYNVCNSV
jgi:hypothetical protein